MQFDIPPRTKQQVRFNAPTPNTDKSSAGVKGRLRTKAEFDADLLAWIFQVQADGRLKPSAVRVALVIAEHLNRKTGEAFPSTKRIAECGSMKQPNINRLIRMLEAGGHIAIDNGSAGSGHSHHYRPLVKVREALQPSLPKPVRAAKKHMPSYVSDADAAEMKHMWVYENPKVSKNRKKSTEGGGSAAVPSRVEHLISDSCAAAGVTPAQASSTAWSAVAERVDPVFKIVQDRDSAGADRLVPNDYLQNKHQPESFLNASCLEMGTAPPRNGGLLIDEAGNVLDDVDEIETPPPKARDRTFAEAIYGGVR